MTRASDTLATTPEWDGTTDDGEATETRIETEPPDADDHTKPAGADDVTRRSGVGWRRVVAYGVLPGLALLITGLGGYLKWLSSSFDDAQFARTESVHAATNNTIAMLSYRPGSVERDLNAARNGLGGTLKDSYNSLIHDVVIPGSKQRQVSATATVPSAASVSASANHAVVLIFVNQTVIIGADRPTNTASSVRVTLDKVDNRWLTTAFDPI